MLSRERQLEMALEQISAVASAAVGDLETMQRWHPLSKRGDNYQRALVSLVQRLTALEQEARDALSTGATA